MAHDRDEILYLNHAGTSWPKPTAVLEASSGFYHCSPTIWPELFERSHHAIAEFFHVEAERLLVTPSCTTALNLAITSHGWQSGDRIVTSHFEHHALQRNLEELRKLGVEVVVIGPDDESLVDLAALQHQLEVPGNRLVAMTAACNVTGQLLPVDEVVAMSHDAGVSVLIDGAQVAGWCDLDLIALGVDLFTFAGHKGLQAPFGIGGLYVASHQRMQCATATCDVTSVPDKAFMPGYCDAGSVNMAAMLGMTAACRWLKEPSRQDRLVQAREFMTKIGDGIRELTEFQILHDVPFDQKMPSLAITHASVSAADLAARLKKLGIIASAGYQCSPQSHLALGTESAGVLRISIGPESGDIATRLIDGLRRAVA